MGNTITINDGSGQSTTPALVLGYETSRQSNNLVHDALDGTIAVAVYPTRPRAGTLRLLYTTEGAADAALDMHAKEATFTLASTDRPTIGMTYIVEGQAELALDEDTRELWTVDVGYQEIIP